MRWWWSATLALVFAGSPVAIANAEPTGSSVAVEPLQFEGPLDEARRTRFEQSIAEGLEQAHLDVVDASAADYHIVGSVSLEDRDHQIELRVMDAQRKNVLARASRQCEVCGLEEALEAAQRLAATIGGKVDALALAPPMLIVTSEPPGASLRIDGDPAGITPLRRQVEAGEHELRASLRGHVDETRRVVAIAGTDETVDFRLQRSAKRSVRRTVGWVALGTGVAALAVGVPFIVIHDRPVRIRCSGSDADAEGDCRFRHQTLYHGIGLTIAGAALVATGLGLALAKPKRSKQRAWVRPAGLALAGEF